MAGTRTVFTWDPLVGGSLDVAVVESPEPPVDPDVVLAAVAEGVCALDSSGAIAYANPAAGVVLGWEPRELVGQNLHALLHPHHTAARPAGCPLGHDGAPGDAWRIDSDTFFRREGTAFSACYVLHVAEDGRSILTFRDTTDRQLAEQVVYEARQQFQTAFMHAPVAMAIVALDGHVTRINPALTRTFGFRDVEIIGRELAVLAPPDGRRELEREVRALAEQPSGGEDAQEHELELLHLSGDPRWVRAHLSLVRDVLGDPRHLLAQLVDITEHREAQQVLARRPLEDPLTGLPGRELILDRLKQALRSAERTGDVVAVLFCDLDRFKEVNDTLGHSAGDRVLALVGDRLRSALRGADTAGRIGGDEFIVVCTGLEGDVDAPRIAARIADALAQPVLLDGLEIDVSCSIGIALARPGDEPGALLRAADAAMYRAKERGGGRWDFYDERLRAASLRRQAVAHELQLALERHELDVHFQPIVQLSDEAAVAWEALLRWRHPERGLLAPADFLDVAEDSGVMVPIGELLLARVTRRAASGPNGLLHVNASIRQLGRGAVRTSIDRAIKEGLDVARLVVEVPADGLSGARHGVLEELTSLRAIGVRLVVDGLGAGFVSPHLLRRFGVGMVKIDRSVVRDLPGDTEATAVAASIIGMARGLGALVAAEGVEVPDQAAELRRLGVDFAQGHLFGAPAPSP